MTLRLLLSSLFISLLAPGAQAATCTWQGGTGSWQSTVSWSCNAVPGAADDVIVNGGVLTLDASVQAKSLLLTNGTITGSADLTLERLTWEAGAMEGSGKTTVQIATTLSGATAKNVRRRVVLHGATTWSNGTIQMGDAGVLVNSAGAIFSDTSVGSHSIARVGSITSEPIVINEGTWQVLSAGTNLNVTFQNLGVIAIVGNGLDVNAPGAFLNEGLLAGSALLDVASGPTVSFGGTTQPGAAAILEFPVRGPFPMTAAHVLDVDLASPTSYDKLTISDGSLAVDGRLKVRVGSPAVAGRSYAIVVHEGSGTVTGCYAPDEIDVVEPDGVTPAPYTVTVTCTNDGLVADVATVTAGEELPNVLAFRLVLDGPNPFSSRTALLLTADDPGSVSVELFDATGRRVQVLFEGRVAAGQSVRLPLDGMPLATGQYVVRATGRGGAITRSLARVR